MMRLSYEVDGRKYLEHINNATSGDTYKDVLMMILQ